MSLVSNVKKVTVADLVENMEVQLSIQNHQVARIYKLIMKLKDTEFVSLEDTQDTLKSVFLRELEDAIENHVIFLSKLSGIKNFMSSSRLEASSEADEDDSGVRTQEVDNDDDADDDYDGGDDLGSDVQKRKQQATDEMDYEDGSDVDHGEDELSTELEKRNSDVDHLEDIETGKDEETEHSDDKDETSNVQNADEVMSEAKSGGKKSRATSKRIEKSRKESSDKKIRRAIYMEVKGLSFEVHFRFTTEPHLLLAQVFSSPFCFTFHVKRVNCCILSWLLSMLLQ